MNVTLDSASVEAVAQRVCELLRGEDVSPEMVDAAEVARRFHVSRDFIYENAERLGAVRLGDGPKARLRFDPAIVAERLSPTVHTPQMPATLKRAAHRPRPSGNVALLPIRGPRSHQKAEA